MRTAEETAVLITILFKRSGQKRARISEKTVRRLAKRARLRTAFLKMVRECLDDFGLVLVELDRVGGGYGLIPTDVLNGAPAITAKAYMQRELNNIKSDPNAVLARLRNELDNDNDEADEE